MGPEGPEIPDVQANLSGSSGPFSGLSVCSVSPAETLPLAVLFSSSAHCAGVQTPADVVEAVHAGRERCLRRVQAAGEQDLRLFKLQQPYLPTMLDDGFQVAATLVQVRDCESPTTSTIECL